MIKKILTTAVILCLVFSGCTLESTKQFNQTNNQTNPNRTYLSIDRSQFPMELLAEPEFTNNLISTFPDYQIINNFLENIPDSQWQEIHFFWTGKPDNTTSYTICFPDINISNQTTDDSKLQPYYLIKISSGICLSTEHNNLALSVHPAKAFITFHEISYSALTPLATNFYPPEYQNPISTIDTAISQTALKILIKNTPLSLYQNIDNIIINSPQSNISANQKNSCNSVNFYTNSQSISDLELAEVTNQILKLSYLDINSFYPENITRTNLTNDQTNFQITFNYENDSSAVSVFEHLTTELKQKKNYITEERQLPDLSPALIHNSSTNNILLQIEPDFLSYTSDNNQTTFIILQGNSIQLANQSKPIDCPQDNLLDINWKTLSKSISSSFKSQKIPENINITSINPLTGLITN